MPYYHKLRTKKMGTFFYLRVPGDSQNGWISISLKNGRHKIKFVMPVIAGIPDIDRTGIFGNNRIRTINNYFKSFKEGKKLEDYREKGLPERDAPFYIPVNVVTFERNRQELINWGIGLIPEVLVRLQEEETLCPYKKRTLNELAPLFLRKFFAQYGCIVSRYTHTEVEETQKMVLSPVFITTPLGRISREMREKWRKSLKSS